MGPRPAFSPPGAAGGSPHRVRLAGTVLPLASVRRDRARLATLFRKARAEYGCAYCLCCPGRDLRLVIRVRDGRYHLAGWPGEGDEHAADCEFHKLAPALSGRTSYAEGAIVERPDTLSVRLNQPLALRLTGAAPPPAAPGTTDAEARRGVGLLGVTQLLWEIAGLNHRTPDTPRTIWSSCHRRVSSHLPHITVSGEPLETVLYLVPPFRRDTAPSAGHALKAFTERLVPGPRVARHGLVMGEIKEIGQTRYGLQMSLRHFPRRLYLDDALLARLTRSYPRALSPSAAASRKARQVGLFVVARSSGGHLSVVDGSVMLTTREYLPADSLHEVTMAEALTAGGLRFHKPLRYEGTGVFPDFVISNAGRDPVYVEVYGVRGREGYDLRRRRKQELYRASGIPVIAWTVSEPLPPLPRPVLDEER
ncbi:DUF1173 family protein [Streptomyces mirabilis]|uniref:DUF1173 family protein n=1 Tax=Streptomyces mirabilis TaxID=68239 RepID=UPI0033F01934